MDFAYQNFTQVTNLQTLTVDSFWEIGIVHAFSFESDNNILMMFSLKRTSLKLYLCFEKDKKDLQSQTLSYK